MNEHSKPKKTTYIPLPFRNGNKIVKKYTEFYEGGDLPSAYIFQLDFLNHKGKLQIGFITRIKWIN